MYLNHCWRLSIPPLPPSLSPSLPPSLPPPPSLPTSPLPPSLSQGISAKVNKEPCCDWVGADGAGHYVKMVHNGIEYGDMQVRGVVINSGCGQHNSLSSSFARLMTSWRISWACQLTKCLPCSQSGTRGNLTPSLSRLPPISWRTRWAGHYVAIAMCIVCIWDYIALLLYWMYELLY